MLKAIFINLAVFIGLLLLVEAGIFIAVKLPQRSEPSVAPPAMKYVRDQFERRIVDNKNPSERNNLLIVAGCSLVFGDGVSEAETLPQIVSDHSKSYYVYNLGVRGGGVHNLLSMLMDPSLPEKIDLARRNEKATLVFVFWSEHVKRTAGTMWYVSQWRSTEPYFDVTEEDRVVYRGSYAEAKPFLTAFYRLLGMSQLVSYLNFDWPRDITEGQIAYTARLMKEAQAVFKAKFGSDRFYVVSYAPFYAQFHAKFAEAFKKQNINHIDYSHSIEGLKKEYWLPDYHPAGPLNRDIAKLLVEDLGI